MIEHVIAGIVGLVVGRWLFLEVRYRRFQRDCRRLNDQMSAGHTKAILTFDGQSMPQLLPWEAKDSDV